jgi:hypothetical protein
MTVGIYLTFDEAKLLNGMVNRYVPSREERQIKVGILKKLGEAFEFIEKESAFLQQQEDPQ